MNCLPISVKVLSLPGNVRTFSDVQGTSVSHEPLLLPKIFGNIHNIS